MENVFVMKVYFLSRFHYVALVQDNIDNIIIIEVFVVQGRTAMEHGYGYNHSTTYLCCVRISAALT